MFNYEKQKYSSKEHIISLQEIAAPDLRGVVGQEGCARLPSMLRRVLPPSLVHVAAIVPRLTCKPSFSNSPRMRLVPQRRFSTANCLISAIVSTSRRGGRLCPWDLC